MRCRKVPLNRIRAAWLDKVMSRALNVRSADREWYACRRSKGKGRA
jgi:hypothetical protein